MMKKLMLGTALTMAFGAASPVHAAATILFDRDGAANGVSTIAVDNFDWIPNNVLVLGALGAPATAGVPVVTQVVAQGRLGTFVQPGGGSQIPLGTSEFTFQASFFETSVGIGTATAGFSSAAGPSSFTIFYDTISDSDPITGLGYGASGTSVPILTGSLVGLTGNFTDFTVLGGLAPVLLDQLNADNQNGTMSHQGVGQTTVQIDVAPGGFDANFFLSNISSLLIDLQDTTANGMPFLQTDPSNTILGFTPFYSLVGPSRENGAFNTIGCQDETGAGGANVAGRCDIHLQTDATTSFNPVPEPSSLALLGIALGASGLIRRRKVA